MPVIIETPGEGTGWGVSLTSSNPEPHEFIPVKDKDQAIRLKGALETYRCPRCGSEKILPPSRSFPDYLTCDPCGHDFKW